MSEAGGSESRVYLTVVVPVFNERDNLDALVHRLSDALAGLQRSWQLLIVDDGSTDGSGELLDNLARDRSWLRVLHFEANCGQSAALDAGFRHSTGELVAILDADLQTYPEDLPGMIDELEASGVDAVVGIRARRRDTWWRRFSSRFANGVRNWLTREDITDTGCPIKVFRGDAVRSLALFDGMHRFVPTLMKMHGFTVRQRPVRHTRRVAGTSKYGTWDRAFRGLRDALAVRWMQERLLRWRLRG